MSAIGNLLWLLAGGFITGLLWFVAGALMFCSIVGIPWGRACFVMGNFAFMPFGREAISRSELTGRSDLGTGSLGLLGNIVWFLFGGLWLALAHAISGLVCAITVIGIPFAIQHMKLGSLAISPIGKTIVSKHTANAARTAEAAAFVEQRRRK